MARKAQALQADGSLPVPVLFSERLATLKDEGAALPAQQAMLKAHQRMKQAELGRCFKSGSSFSQSLRDGASS